MKQEPKNEELIIRYLLGDLPESESVEVEDRYFADDGFFEELAIVEEDLINDYINARLIGRKRQLFEDNYLTSATRRNRVEMAKNLIKSISALNTPATPARRESKSGLRSLFTDGPLSLRFAFALAALLTIAVAGWLVFQNSRLRNDINRLQSERTAFEQRAKELDAQSAEQIQRNSELTARLEEEVNDRRQLEQQLAQLQPQAAPVFELTSGSTRGGDALKGFRIPGGTKTVKFKVYLESDDYKTYRITLQGAKTLSKTGLRARTTSAGKELIVDLPAELFSSGSYTLTLGGATTGSDYENFNDYQFKIIKK